MGSICGRHGGQGDSTKAKLPTWAKNIGNGTNKDTLKARVGAGREVREALQETLSPPSTRTRTSTRASRRLRCSERNFEGQEEKRPVQLVIFDFDETLTICTFMPKKNEYTENLKRTCVSYSFESPFAPGMRIPKLIALFKGLTSGDVPRALAILTRNESGVTAVLNLLQAAGLADYFSVIWSMPFRHGQANGLYRNPDDQGDWTYFSPPAGEIPDHKADVLNAMVARPGDWLPQLGCTTENIIKQLGPLRPEGLLLVDDERENFQSASGARVLRYCKVARYGANLRQAGWFDCLGGIGAYDEDDYEALMRFVQEPWLSKEALQITCTDRSPDATSARVPIQLIVFDFDETLTMATFMPSDSSFGEQIGWTPSAAVERDVQQGGEDDDWSIEALCTWNFLSPFKEGSRLEKLKSMLSALLTSSDGRKRTLVVLTRNDRGVIAVLNLLMLAGLDEYFDAIWTQPWRTDCPNGAYKKGETWKTFEPPVQDVLDHKADLLVHVVENLPSWFPQGVPKGLEGLCINGIALVDDERVNFRSNIAGSNATLVRHVKVARYDDYYRDCGLLNQMGGVGAYSDEDYNNLVLFIEDPLLFHIEPDRRNPAQVADEQDTDLEQELFCTSTRSRASTGGSADSTGRARDRPTSPRPRKSSNVSGLAAADGEASFCDLTDGISSYTITI